MIGYGFLGGHKLEPLARIPLAHESTIIARCQSARSVHGRAAEAWSYEESDAWLRNAARVKRHGVTVPQPLCRSAQENTSTPVECAQAGSSLPSGVSCDREHEHTAGRQFIHSSPCGCVDDAQRHYALIARDLIAAGRDGELTDDMRQAYDYEFGGVVEPEPIQIPEF